MGAGAAELRSLEECLRGLIAVLPQDPARAREAIRELLARDRDRFLAVALSLLRESDSPGLQYLFVLLLANNLLPPCNPRLLSLEDEIRIARRVQQADPMLDLKLARRFSAVAEDAGAPEVDTASRILEVLSAISDRSRILPTLVQALRHSDARLRSKVALLVARSNHSAEWVSRMLSEPDARVRANAVEALWGVETEAARDVFRRASRDSNNRVVGNALLGLYRQGDTAAIPALLELSAHEQPLFRSTAAWTMGETGDPRFLPRLGQMVRETDTKARHSVFRAIGRINGALAALRQQPRLRVYTLQRLAQADGSRLLRVAVALEDGGEVSGLRPTGFVLEESGGLVHDFAVHKHSPPGSLPLGIALPAARAEALEGCLGAKRSADRWPMVRFAAHEGSPENALRMLKAGTAVDLRAGSLEAVGLLLGILGAADGPRHLLLVEPGWSEPDAQRWEAAAKAAQSASVSLHAIGLRHPEADALSRLCLATGGLFLAAGSADEFPGLCEKLLASLLRGYEIAYRGEGVEGELKLQVYSPQGFGEDTLRT